MRNRFQNINDQSHPSNDDSSSISVSTSTKIVRRLESLIWIVIALLLIQYTSISNKIWSYRTRYEIDDFLFEFNSNSVHLFSQLCYQSSLQPVVFFTLLYMLLID